MCVRAQWRTGSRKRERPIDSRDRRGGAGGRGWRRAGRRRLQRRRRVALAGGRRAGARCRGQLQPGGGLGLKPHQVPARGGRVGEGAPLPQTPVHSMNGSTAGRDGTVQQGPHLSWRLRSARDTAAARHADVACWASSSRRRLLPLSRRGGGKAAALEAALAAGPAPPALAPGGSASAAPAASAALRTGGCELPLRSSAADSPQRLESVLPAVGRHASEPQTAPPAAPLHPAVSCSASASGAGAQQQEPTDSAAEAAGVERLPAPELGCDGAKRAHWQAAARRGGGGEGRGSPSGARIVRPLSATSSCSCQGAGGCARRGAQACQRAPPWLEPGWPLPGRRTGARGLHIASSMCEEARGRRTTVVDPKSSPNRAMRPPPLLISTACFGTCSPPLPAYKCLVQPCSCWCREASGGVVTNGGEETRRLRATMHAA